MTCYKCPNCEIELCIGKSNPSDGDMSCPSCQGNMKVLNSEDF